MLTLMRNLSIGAVVTGGVIYSSTFVVYPGEAAVMYNRISGVKDTTYGEGMHMRILGVDQPKVFDIRLRPRVLNTMTGTKDLQMVNIRLRVLFHPIVDELSNTYKTLGFDYDERVLPSVSNEILKAVVAEYKAEDLIQKREQVSHQISDLMVEKARHFGVDIKDLSLVDIQFGKDFMTAVEAKQVAQQEAQRFKYVVLEAEQTKRASIIRAEGEAESARLISTAIQKSGNGLVQLRKIEAAVAIAKDLAGSPNVNFVPQANMLLNLGK